MWCSVLEGGNVGWELKGVSLGTSKHTKTETTRKAAFCRPTLPYPRPTSPLPPHLVLRLLIRLSGQKLLHHRRMTFDCSVMQRRRSILRRAAAIRPPPPLHCASACTPPAPATLLPHTQWGGALQKQTLKLKCLVQSNLLPFWVAIWSIRGSSSYEINCLMPLWAF